MTDDKYRGTVEDLVYLLSCTVNGAPVDGVRAGAMDLSALYEIADRHLLTGITAMALESAGIDITKYGQYLQSLYQKYPVITSQGAVKAGGDFVDAPGAQPELLDYSCLIYNGLSDPDNRADIY